MFFQHLTDRSLLRISGEDAENFLETIVTCKVAGMAEGSANFGALLTPQGKILFDFFILKRAKGFLLDVHETLIEELSKRLLFYRLRARVVVEPLEAPPMVFGCWSDDEPTSDEICIVDPRLADMGWRIYSRSPPAGERSDYLHHRIALGMPEGGADFSYGGAYPHDALMDQFGGVDFQKGCYVGQEVVSRIQHRGSARKRVVMVTSKSALPLNNTTVTAGGRPAGNLGSVHQNSGLALLRLDRIAAALVVFEPVLAGETEVNVILQKWVNFSWPEVD